jgi:hypothetical protein
MIALAHTCSRFLRLLALLARRPFAIHPLRQVLHEADLRVINLETSITAQALK